MNKGKTKQKETPQSIQIPGVKARKRRPQGLFLTQFIYIPQRYIPGQLRKPGIFQKTNNKIKYNHWKKYTILGKRKGNTIKDGSPQKKRKLTLIEENDSDTPSI